MADRPPRILNVNDDEAGRYVITAALRRAGFDVREAASGVEALARMEDAPDLVVLDVKLPDLSGFEVCRRIKGSPATASTLVLHLSANMVETPNRVRGLEEGADGYLAQPIEPSELIATVRALLRLKRAEDAARTAELHWEATFESMRDGAAVVGGTGLVERCNSAFAELLGRERAGLQGQPLRALLGEAPEAEGAPWELERAGRWLRASVAPVHPTGNAVVTLVDLSERRQMEEALRQRSSELLEADRRKDQFLAMLAHELRNPLAALTTGLHLIQKSGGAPERVLEVVKRQGQHLARLVDDLLDVSRLTHGRIALRQEPLDLRTVVQNAVFLRRPALEAQGVEVSTQVCPESLPLDGDATRLEQVVGNLLENAAKYTPPGGRVWIHLGAEEAEGRRSAVLTVRDTGVGISPRLLPRIFDLFAQGDESLDRAKGGLGIGLTLVKRLVELHGGQVGAKSGGEGAGAELTVRLPLSGRAHSRVSRARTEGGQGRHILLVEDNADARELLRELLEGWGHEVDIALDGPTGVALALSRRPEVAIVDIGLPGLDGYEVARQIRRQERGRPILLMALTGYGGSDAQEQAFKAGFDRHLVKPVDPEALQGLLAQAGAPSPGERNSSCS